MLFASFAAMAMLTYLNFVQPYILEEILDIPDDVQGSVTGNLAALQEVVVILFIGFIGALSDRTGQRVMFAAGFAICALGLFLYPLAADLPQLYAYRAVFSVGAAAIPVMLTACLTHYTQEVSRGTWIGINAVLNGAGVLFMALVLARLPDLLHAQGLDMVPAVRYSVWAAGGVGLVSALVLYLGIRDCVHLPEDKPTVLDQIGKGILVSRDNPKVALSYFATFAARGGLVVVGSFFSLWAVRAGADQGISTTDSMVRAGMLFGVLQLSALVAGGLAGLLLDRINRLTGICLAFGVAALGYGIMGNMSSPFSGMLIPVAILVGIGETSCVVAGATLFGQECPTALRNAASGVANFIGAVAILLATFFGGQLFDGIGYGAPFTMMSVIYAIVLAVAMLMRLRDNRPGSVHQSVRDPGTGTTGGG